MIFLDIETIPTQDAYIIEQISKDIKPPAQMKKAETIAEWEKTEKQNAINEAVGKTGLDGCYGQIVCIGYAIDDGEVTSIAHKNEKKILEMFFYDANAQIQNYCGHNLTAFDLRFIFHRAVINNVKPPMGFPINAKSWDSAIFDTMTYWAGHGNRISLDKLSRALCLQGKDDSFTWEDVLPAYLAGDFGAISEYCEKDVALTREVYKRLTFKD